MSPLTPCRTVARAPASRRLKRLLSLTALCVLQAPSLAVAQDGAWARAVDFFSFRYSFLKLTVAGAVMVGVTCGVLGAFMVLRRLSLMGDALGHAALPGVGLAFMLTQTKALGPMIVGAGATALLAALTMGFITRHSRTYPDAALGMVMASFFGLGIVALSYIQNMPSAAKSGLNDFLFGNAAAIRPEELWLLAALMVVVLGCAAALYRPLQLLTFDETLAQTMGLPVRWLHYGMMALAALTIVASIQSVGVVLVAAMLITPASTAHLLTDRLWVMLIISGALGALSGLLGAMLSYIFDGFSSGPSMVLVASTFFALTFLFAPRRGLLAQWWRRRQRRAGSSGAPEGGS